MFNCPKCGESFSYGYPCIHELILKLLYHGRWKCSNCGFITISDCQIVQLDNNQKEELLKQCKENDIASL